MIKLIDLLKESSGEQKPYMHSPVGFSCKVCSYLNYNKDEGAYTCGSTEYQQHMGTHFLVKEDGQTKLTKEDLPYYCSNWFEPKGQLQEDYPDESSKNSKDALQKIDRAYLDMLRKLYASQKSSTAFDTLQARKRDLSQDPSAVDPMEKIKKMIDDQEAKMSRDYGTASIQEKKEKPGLWANIRAKRERGEAPAKKGSKAYKSAVKAAKEINRKTKD